MTKAKQIRLGADRDLLQAMKTTKEAIIRAKAFDEKLRALCAGVIPTLRFFKEEGDENQTMAELAEMIPNSANAYAKALP